MTSLNLPFSTRSYFGGSYVDKCEFVVSGARKGPPATLSIKRPWKWHLLHVVNERKRHRYFQFFLYLSLPPRMLLFTSFGYFSKMMEFYRFYKHFCASGDFLVAKSAWRRRPAHVRLEQGFLLFQHFWGSRKVFFPMFFLSDSQKTTVFIVSIASLGVSLFDRVF